ncbi:MAG: PIN domain-containing protein [Candidatus Shapirobacteria bacterium]
MRVILDTSAWLASIVQSDVFHRQAKDFLSKKPELVVLESVFEELMALIQSRFTKKTAEKHGEALQGIGIYLLNKEEFENAWRIYCQSKLTISWVDATVIFVSQKLDLPVFTFDRHFKQLKLKTLPWAGG